MKTRHIHIIVIGIIVYAVFIAKAGRPVVKESESEVPLARFTVELPELTVSSRHRPILHLTGYIREISTMSSSADTLLLYREKWVDFMIPTGKEKRYQGWLEPRLLKTKSYYRWTNAMGLDSVSDRANHHFSWSDWISLPGRVNFPSIIAGSKIGTDTIMGIYSPAEIWIKTKEKATVTVDVLADSNATFKRKWTPRLAGPYWRNLDFERMKLEFEYSDIDTFAVRPQNIDHLSCYVESMGRGHDMFRFHTIGDEVYVTTYFDLTITDREYLTVKDARRKETDLLAAMEDAMLIFQSEQMPRDSLIDELIARVESIDHDSRRLAMELDKRVGNMSMFEGKSYTTREKLRRGLKSALKSLGLK